MSKVPSQPAAELYARVVSHLARIDAFLALLDRSEDPAVPRESFRVASGCIGAYTRFARDDLLKLAAEVLAITPAASLALMEDAALDARWTAGLRGFTAAEIFGPGPKPAEAPAPEATAGKEQSV